MKRAAWVAAAAACCAAAAFGQDAERIARHLAMLERPEREAFQKPKEVIAALAFRAGERVADVGAGSGYFTIPVAKKRSGTEAPSGQSISGSRCSTSSRSGYRMRSSRTTTATSKNAAPGTR